MGLGEVCLGGLLVGLGLKLVSVAVAGCWAAGLRCWLRLEGWAVLGRRWMGKACLIHTWA